MLFSGFGVPTLTNICSHFFPNICLFQKISLFFPYNIWSFLKIFFLRHHYNHSHMLPLISTIYMYVFPSRMQAPRGQGWCLTHICKGLSSKLVLIQCSKVAQRWCSSHADLGTRFGKTSMLIHPPQCIETNVEDTDGTSGWSWSSSRVGKKQTSLPGS